MPRTIDATFETSTQQQTGKEEVWFVEFLEASPTTAGTLSRIKTGLVHQLTTTDLVDTTDFTVHQGGTLDLGGAGGRLRIQPGGDLSENFAATYDSGPDPRDRITQIEFFRNVGAATISGHPAVAVGGTVDVFRITEGGDLRETEAADSRTLEAGSGGSPVYLVSKFIVAPPSTTYPGGPFNEDSQLLHWSGVVHTNIGTSTNFSAHVQHPSILSYGADALEIHGFVFPGNAGKITRDPDADPEGVDPIDSSEPPGLHVDWEDAAANDYDDPVEVQHIFVYESRYIHFHNLPPNYFSTVQTGYSASHGNDRGGTTTGLAGYSRADLDGEACPYDSVQVELTGDVGTRVTLTLTDDVWGGDHFWWTPPGYVKFLNLCSHDLTIDADMGDGSGSRTWTGMGMDGLVIDPIGETPDLRAQRVGIDIDAVNLSAALNTLKAKYRGANVKIWQAHHDGTDVVGTPLLVFEGQIDEGLVAEERYSDQGQPGSARVTVQVTSPLAEFDQNPGLRTNEPTLQRWFPGDTGMQTVALIQGKRKFWGPGLPSAPEDAGT